MLAITSLYLTVITNAVAVELMSRRWRAWGRVPPAGDFRSSSVHLRTTPRDLCDVTAQFLPKRNQLYMQPTVRAARDQNEMC